MKSRLNDPFEIILYPWVSEKTSMMMDAEHGENKLDFIVNRRANKQEIKWAVEQLYNAKVKAVNTRIMKEGKHAVVRFAEGYSAEEIGTNIGIL